MNFSRTLDKEGHTLASMVRSRLFENDATFAACVVTHPLNDNLSVTVTHPHNGKQCFIDSLRDAAIDLEKFKQAIAAKRAHDDVYYAAHL